MGETRLRHGHARNGGMSAEYRIWLGITQRCTNPNLLAYRNYGGRGISVCERWRVFENFLSDMGPRPAGASIDRIDNDGNYEPANCRWSSAEEQAQNKRTTKKFSWRGEHHTVATFSSVIGLTRKATAARLSRAGWDAERVYQVAILPKKEQYRLRSWNR